MLATYISIALLVPGLVASYNISALDTKKCLLCGDHICGVGAKCNTTSGKCFCPLSLPIGDPYIGCFGDPYIDCNVVGDPCLNGFPEDLIFVDFADCPYILTVFEARVTIPFVFGGRKLTNANVRFYVEATNGYSPSGEIYVATLRILATLTVQGLSLPSLEITIDAEAITYRLNVPGVRSVRIDKDDTVGCNSRTCFNTNLPLTACFDKSTNAFNVNFAFASTKFFFRGYEETHSVPRQKPGLSIATDIENSIFFKESLFPQAFCDSATNDIPNVYTQECGALGFKDKRVCGLYASATTAHGKDLSPSCSRLVAAFKASSKDSLKKIATTCSVITTRLLGCLSSNAPVADTLADCVNIVGSGRDLGLESSKTGCRAEDVNRAFGIAPNV